MAFGGVVRLFGEVRERDMGGERRDVFFFFYNYINSFALLH